MARIHEDLHIVAHGEFSAGATTATQLTDIGGRFITLRADPDNTGDIHVGVSSAVTVQDAATDQTTGYLLQPGEAIQVPVLDTMAELYVIQTVAGDHLYFLVEGLASQ